MGFHRFIMKYGLGSPGYIARSMASQYVSLKSSHPELEESEVLRRVYCLRIAAQTMVKGPEEYRASKRNPELIDVTLRLNPDLFSLVRCACLIEHPEFNRPGAPQDRFEVLDSVVSEVLEEKASGWKRRDYKSPRIVDEAASNEIPAPQMIWTAWHNAGHDILSGGYGFRISASDRDKYFRREWSSVTIALPKADRYLLASANVDKESFWRDCRELISNEIGSWMIEQGLAPWPKGAPPKFNVRIAGDAAFGIEPTTTSVRKS